MSSLRSLLAVSAIALAPACESETDTTDDEPDAVDDTVDEGYGRGNGLVEQANLEFGEADELIVVGMSASMFAAINDGEIAQASFAVTMVSDTAVSDFANRMIIDHQDANAQLDAALRAYGLPYLPSTTADALTAEANAGLERLRATAPEDMDFAFVELQVIDHAKAQILLDRLYEKVGDGAMADYISNTSVMIDAHLAESRALLETFY